MRVWVTRTAPDAEATAARLRTLGHIPITAPILAVRPLPGLALPGLAPDLEGVAALTFTSRNGVAVFAALNPERRLPVFAVGPSTAEAARAAGYWDVQAAGGDVDSLVGLILRRKATIGGAVLHPGPDKPAGDLAGALNAGGVAARLLPIYATETLPLPRAAAEALAASPLGMDVVLVHSPQAARTLIGYAELAVAAPALTALCISPAAAAPLKPLNFRSVAAAPLPNEQALLNLLAG